MKNLNPSEKALLSFIKEKTNNFQKPISLSSYELSIIGLNTKELKDSFVSLILLGLIHPGENHNKMIMIN